ncbi:hypothetical protein FJQ54_08165 [Sandaracinobacter neustonicus]|uniref:GP-PDE domain-containing protein n=1 Tax=Sandaracinobacter neustonicus TaxID=1715348 RepID=A0A501XLX7_9SPHN|nr:glycerophosphodiester phosphodiesterase family protein [Sandaracinobacter neustonicus]TPE61556.1 hypothetical protein FJQ54_08165 [Sandaracinobacter neustonicus]
MIRTGHVTRIAAMFSLGMCTTPLPAAPSGHAADYPDWHVELVAHRGRSPDRPENTLAAFRQAIALGVDIIEIDLRMTADGEIVILHDPTVDRTTDGTGDVSTLTLDQVKALDAGGRFDARFAGERIPTYEEVLDLVTGTRVKLLLDIKFQNAGNIEQVVRLTEAHGRQLDVVVGVRSFEHLREFQALNPNIRTLGFITSPDQIEAFASAGVDIIRLWSITEADGSTTAAATTTRPTENWIYDDRDSPACKAAVARRQHDYETGRRDDPGSRSCLVQKVHDLGLPVWVSAIDAPYADLDELIQLKVNGILTDWPEVMKILSIEIESLKRTHTRRR